MHENKTSLLASRLPHASRREVHASPIEDHYWTGRVFDKVLSFSRHLYAKKATCFSIRLQEKNEYGVTKIRTWRTSILQLQTHSTTGCCKSSFRFFFSFKLEWLLKLLFLQLGSRASIFPTKASYISN